MGPAVTSMEAPQYLVQYYVWTSWPFIYDLVGVIGDVGTVM